MKKLFILLLPILLLLASPAYGKIRGDLQGNADTATALSGDPSDCSAGSAPTGINALGAAQNCVDYVQQSELLDEDTMSTNSATQPASQQSIKAYVDTQDAAQDECSEITGCVENAITATLTEEEVEDYVGGMVTTTNTETLITVTYQDSTNDMDFVVDSDLANYSWTNVDATDLKVGTVTQAYDADLDDLADGELTGNKIEDVFLSNSGDVGTGTYDFGDATIEIDNGTVASLPSAGTAGRVAVVTDGNSDTDCTSGGGSTVNLCIDTGSAWVIAGDGTTASGADAVSVDGSGVTDPDFVSTGDIDFVNTSNTITANINTGAIVNADVNASAAIDISKTALVGGTNITLSTNTLNVDDAFVINSGSDVMAGTLTADGLTIGDDENITLGTSNDWTINFDDSVDDQLLIATTNTASGATTDPMFEILVGSTPTADQQVFGVAKGTQASNTPLLTLDEDGDMVIAGTLTTGGSGDTTVADLIVSTSLNIPHSTSLPGTCDVGDAYMDTDATSGQRMYLCESTNTWALQGDGTGSGSSPFTDAGTTTYLTTTTDDLAIGTSSPVNSSKFSIDGDADQVQFTVQANGTQTDSVVIVENSGGTEVLNIEADGTILTAVGLDAIGATDMDYGSADVTDHTFITDSTGDGEIVLPNDSIGVNELNWAGIDADASAVNTGTSTELAVTPDGLAGSNYGIRYVSILVFDDATDTATGNGAGDVFWRVPAALNGFNLVSVAAQVQTAGTTGNLDIQVHNVTDTADMLTTAMRVETGETDTSTSAQPGTINTSTDDVATGDSLRVDVDSVQTTAAKGLLVELGFQLP